MATVAARITHNTRSPSGPVVVVQCRCATQRSIVLGAALGASTDARCVSSDMWGSIDDAGAQTQV